MQPTELSPTWLNIHYEDQGRFALVHASGECDLTNAGQLIRALEQAAELSPFVVLDLAGLTYLDSSGISVLLQVWKALRARSGVLVIVACRPPVTRVVHVVGLNHLMPIVGTIEEAIARLASSSPTGASA
ncbi:MAG: STAS domain-containing protein [Armatimonadetes bacterium]|nr:STAS domain-containing protein [Armatimonadota bacterium]